MENNTVIDLNSLPETLDPKKLIAMMKQHGTMPIYTNDTNPYVGGVGQGIFSQIKNSKNSYEPTKSTWELIEEIKLENKILHIKILVLEGVFTKEEGNNIKAMLTSNDEASITLAETILENAEQ